MVYKFKDGSRWPVSAQIAGETIEQIRAAHGGIVTPRFLVEESRDPDAPLHRCFEWDPERAAEKYRDVQARTLIRNVWVVEVEDEDDEEGAVRDFGPDEPPKVRLGYVVVTHPEAGKGYTTVDIAVSDEDMFRQVLSDALKGLRGWQRRYGQLEEFHEVVEAIENIAARIENAPAGR